MSDFEWNQNRALNWHLFTPPARPSPGELAVYDALVRELSLQREPLWTLLGATPEIRTLAARYGINLLSIDRSRDVYTALGSLMNAEGPHEFICSDWMSAEVSDRDVVYGDGSMNMLPGDKHQGFIDRIHAILKPGGWLILRTHLAGPPRFTSAEEVFAWSRSQSSAENVFTRTRTHLDMLWAEPGSLRVSFPEYHQRLLRLRDENVVSDDEFQAYNQLIEFNRISIYYTTHDALMQLTAGRFTLDRICSGNDYTGHENHPVYVFRRNEP